MTATNGKTADWEIALEDVFKANGSQEWEEAAAKFSETLPATTKAKKKVAQQLCALLDKEETSARRRSRIISLLPRFQMPELCEKVVPFTDPVHEASDRVQYWALSALAALQPENLEAILNKIIENPEINSRVTALARRIQIQNHALDADKQTQYFEDLLLMTGDGNADNRWSVMSALINNGFLDETLPQELERRSIVDLLGPSLMNEGEWRDVRVQAARTLGTVQHNYAEAVSVLITTYRQTTSEDIKRHCLESLAKIGVKPELKKSQHEQQRRDIQHFMIEVLKDSDPDLRTRAIDTLKQSLSTKGALETVVGAILKQEKDVAIPLGYVEALQRIDPTPDNQTAVDILTQHLWHPDPDVQLRASATMELVGGEKAMRILIGQQRQFIDTYTKILNDADEQIMTQFDQLMKNARTGFRVSMTMHVAIFLFGIGLLITSLVMAILSEKWWWLTGSFLGTLASILASFYDKPLRNIHQSTLNLVKVNIAFLGYMRQINQIDATFKQLFLNPTLFDLNQMNSTVKQIQNAVNESLDKVQTFVEMQESENSA